MTKEELENKIIDLSKEQLTVQIAMDKVAANFGRLKKQEEELTEKIKEAQYELREIIKSEMDNEEIMSLAY